MLRLVEPATHLDNVDPQLVIRLGELIERLRAVYPLTNETDGIVVHGDAHFNNVIWNGSRLVALLDYEWARFGPPDSTAARRLESGRRCRDTEGKLPSWHPKRRLPMVVDGPGYIEALLSGM